MFDDDDVFGQPAPFAQQQQHVQQAAQAMCPVGLIKVLMGVVYACLSVMAT